MRCQHCECQQEERRDRAPTFPVMHAIVWHAAFKAIGLPGWMGAATSVTMTTVIPMALFIAIIETFG